MKLSARIGAPLDILLAAAEEREAELFGGRETKKSEDESSKFK